MASAKKLPSGNWRARVFYKDADGKEQCESFTADTKKEAEYLAAQFKVTRKEQTDCKLTLRAAAERYIESKRNVLSPSTIKGYKAIIKNYVQDLFSMRVSDITQEAIQISINNLAVSKKAKTCRNVHGFITAVLGVYRPDFIPHTTLPQKDHYDIYVPDQEEVQRIHEMVRGTPNEIAVFLAAECGLRESEISALRVENVTPEYVFVKEARVLDENNVVQIKAPKSATSYRKVPITKEVCDYLHEHSSDGMVCPIVSRAISSNWCEFRGKNNLNEKLNFHAFRHHYASKCILLGIPQKYIAELMGHSSTDMIERVYQHIFPSAMEQFAEKIRDQMPPLDR